MGELKEFLSSIDTNSNSRIDYNEFLSVCLGEAIFANEDYLRYVFNSFDLNKDGKIERNELKVILRAYCNDFKCNTELVDEIMK